MSQIQIFEIEIEDSEDEGDYRVSKYSTFVSEEEYETDDDEPKAWEVDKFCKVN